MANLPENNHFTYTNGALNVKRSQFDYSHSLVTTMNSGDLVPIFYEEVLPADTWKGGTNVITRMLTPVVPTMDNCFMDIYYFFVPNRIIASAIIEDYSMTKDWETLMGANKTTYWANEEETKLKGIYFQGCDSMSVANYFGLPIGHFQQGSPTYCMQINAIPFAAYNLIWNDWFRDENTQAPVPLTNGFLNTESQTDDYFISDATYTTYVDTATNYGLTGNCLKVNKYHDYFTSALPAPQKGETPSIVFTGTGELLAGDSLNDLGGNLLFGADTMPASGNDDTSLNIDSNGNVTYSDGFPGNENGGLPINITKTNLYVDLQNQAELTINQLRQLFAVQALLEKDALGGTRYIEMLKSHFGVAPTNYELDRPEYLGGQRIPINIMQVIQTSSTTETSPLGEAGAFSNTYYNSIAGVSKSFEEHGSIIGLACIRTTQSYCQGIARKFTRFERFDFYFPIFANLGEQPIYNYEQFVTTEASTAQSTNNEVFGYKEAWAEYRYSPNLVTGNVDPNSGDNTLQAYTYVNRFSEAPVLNSDYMKQSSENIGNTLIDTTTTTQFICQFYFDFKVSRAMPVRSIPKLIG